MGKGNHGVVLIELEKGPRVLVGDEVKTLLRVLGSEDGECLASLAIVSVFHGPSVLWEVLDNLPLLPV